MAERLPQNHQEALAKEGMCSCLNCQIYKVDQVVKRKMNRLRKHYIIKEQIYVNEMLAYEENKQGQPKSSATTTDTAPLTFLHILSPYLSEEQMQAHHSNAKEAKEAKDKSNNGDEKLMDEAAALPPAEDVAEAKDSAPGTAKGQTSKETRSKESVEISMMIRNRYVMEKLTKNITKLENLHDFAHEKEQELLDLGYNRGKLVCMRQIFGIKKATIRFIRESATKQLLLEEAPSFYD